MAKRASWLLPTAAVAAWIVAGWIFVALPLFERFSANGDLSVVCMKRGVSAPPGVIPEHMTDATITGFPPQLNCNWSWPVGGIVTVQVPFYQPWKYLVAIAALALSFVWVRGMRKGSGMAEVDAGTQVRADRRYRWLRIVLGAVIAGLAIADIIYFRLTVIEYRGVEAVAIERGLEPPIGEGLILVGALMIGWPRRHGPRDPSTPARPVYTWLRVAVALGLIILSAVVILLSLKSGGPWGRWVLLGPISAIGGPVLLATGIIVAAWPPQDATDHRSALGRSPDPGSRVDAGRGYRWGRAAVGGVIVVLGVAVILSDIVQYLAQRATTMPGLNDGTWFLVRWLPPAAQGLILTGALMIGWPPRPTLHTHSALSRPVHLWLRNAVAVILIIFAMVVGIAGDARSNSEWASALWPLGTIGGPVLLAIGIITAAWPQTSSGNRTTNQQT